MPCDYSKYPPDWREISKGVREAAGNRCEICGVANGAVIFRALDGSCWYDPAEDSYFRYPSGERIEGRFEADCREKATRVVLTVAHTNRNGADKHDKHDLRGLVAMCNACHLAEDLHDHVTNGRRTRHARRAIGELPGLEPTP